MSFKNKVLSKYLVKAEEEWKEDLALLLLSDAIATEVEYMREDNKISDEDFRKVVAPQEDIVDKVESTTDKAGMKIDKYLPLDIITKMAECIKNTLKVSLKDIYEEDEQWAYDTVLVLLGHGVSPFDDSSFQGWLNEQGSDVTEDSWKHKHFEGAIEKAGEWVDEVLLKEEE